MNFCSYVNFWLDGFVYLIDAIVLIFVIDGGKTFQWKEGATFPIVNCSSCTVEPPGFFLCYGRWFPVEEAEMEEEEEGEEEEEVQRNQLPFYKYLLMIAHSLFMKFA